MTRGRSDKREEKSGKMEITSGINRCVNQAQKKTGKHQMIGHNNNV
jgi:hypothetical protein